MCVHSSTHVWLHVRLCVPKCVRADDTQGYWVACARPASLWTDWPAIVFNSRFTVWNPSQMGKQAGHRPAVAGFCWFSIQIHFFFFNYKALLCCVQFFLFQQITMDRQNVPLNELRHGWVRTGIYNFRVGIHTASNRTHPYYTRTLIETPCSFIQVWFIVRDILLRVKSQPRVEREWCCSHTRQTSTPAAINIVPHEASMAAKNLIVLFDWSCWDRKKNCLCLHLVLSK